jgi:diguanylate cyclase (GGDEF)-like protein
VSVLRGKMIVLSMVATLVALMAALAVTSHLFIKRFDTIELAQTVERAAQVARALEADLDQLAMSTRDYAEWDDAHAYVVGQAPNFLSANFSVDSLQGMHVDIVGILAADGVAMYSALLEESGTRLASPAPRELVDVFRGLLLAQPALRQLPSTRRIVPTPHGLLAFSAVEVRRSDKSDATGAVMFFARFLRSDEIERVRQTSRLPAQLLPIGRPAASHPALPRNVQAWLRGSSGESQLDAAVSSENSVMGYALVRDVQGQPLAYFTTAHERDVGQLGRRTTWGVMGTLAALLIASACALLAMMLRLRKSWAEHAALENQHRNVLTHLDENQNRLAHLIEHDPLTELPNRRYLDARLPQLLSRLQSQRQSLALLHIDLDNFKNVNDCGGHGQGDAVLKVIARRLCTAAAAQDVVLRMGGDEFAVIAPDIEGAPAIRKLAERLLNALRGPISLGDLQLSLTASVGISVYPQDGSDGETLLKHADIALHEAKQRGRDCFAKFSSDMNAQVNEHLALEQALRRAIDSDQIYVDYQPVVDLQTGLLASFEALARWRHPELGMVSPGRFIPVAEKSGLIVGLTERVVRQVIAQLSEWQRAGLLLAPVAVNVAPIQFERTQFPNFVHATALEHEIDPRWISFEVTESAWLQNSSKHVVMIDTLRHEGSRIYIDDFGTGFSNLSYLKTLPVDAVKIDQSFIRGIETDASDEAIVSGIIAMSRQLNLATVAEGIETAGQAQCLRTMGCRYGQGYYFSKPIAAANCRALLEQLAAVQRVTETLTMRAFRKVAT